MLRLATRFLIFTQYPNLVWNNWRLPERIKKYLPIRFDGSVSSDSRFEFPRRFQNDESIRVALLEPEGGRTGLTLTRANHVVFLDQWWNPAVMEQAAARIHRIGQSRMCEITALVAKDTIDERIPVILKAASKNSLTISWRIYGRAGKRMAILRASATR